MKGRKAKLLILISVVFVATFATLAFVPHHTCGCGQYEDGSQLTHIINTVAEKTFGEPLIEKNPSPYH